MNARDALQKSPEIIRKTELDLWAHKEKREAALLKVKLREADVALAVAEAWRNEGRKSNEAERDGETRRRLQHDAPYNDARREAEEEKAICARIEAALEFHRNRQRNARALALSASPLDLVFEGDEP